MSRGIYDDDSAPGCPVCESNDAVEVNHPAGRWCCGECSLLFDGGGVEALALAGRKREYFERRDSPRPPLPPMRSRRKANEPVRRRMSEQSGGEEETQSQ